MASLFTKESTITEHMSADRPPVICFSNHDVRRSVDALQRSTEAMQSAVNVSRALIEQSHRHEITILKYGTFSSFDDQIALLEWLGYCNGSNGVSSLQTINKWSPAAYVSPGHGTNSLAVDLISST